jgi:hypothetical protein
LSSLHHGIFFASAATADNCTDNCTFCRQLAQSTAYILCVNNCITAQTATSAFWVDFPFFLTQQAFCIFLSLYHFGTFGAREFFSLYSGTCSIYTPTKRRSYDGKYDKALFTAFVAFIRTICPAQPGLDTYSLYQTIVYGLHNPLSSWRCIFIVFSFLSTLLKRIWIEAWALLPTTWKGLMSRFAKRGDDNVQEVLHMSGRWDGLGRQLPFPTDLISPRVR